MWHHVRWSGWSGCGWMWMDVVWYLHVSPVSSNGPSLAPLPSPWRSWRTALAIRAAHHAFPHFNTTCSKLFQAVSVILNNFERWVMNQNMSKLWTTRMDGFIGFMVVFHVKIYKHMWKFRVDLLGPPIWTTIPYRSHSCHSYLSNFLNSSLLQVEIKWIEKPSGNLISTPWFFRWSWTYSPWSKSQRSAFKSIFLSIEGWSSSLAKDVKSLCTPSCQQICWTSDKAPHCGHANAQHHNERKNIPSHATIQASQSQHVAQHVGFQQQHVSFLFTIAVIGPPMLPVFLHENYCSIVCTH